MNGSKMLKQVQHDAMRIYTYKPIHLSTYQLWE